MITGSGHNFLMTVVASMHVHVGHVDIQLHDVSVLANEVND